MRITSKGQVTIPQEMRDKAGLLPGTEVEFAFEDGKLCVSKSRMEPVAGGLLSACAERARFV